MGSYNSIFVMANKETSVPSDLKLSDAIPVTLVKDKKKLLARGELFQFVPDATEADLGTVLTYNGNGLYEWQKHSLLNENGLIDASLLPSYVDDVLEFQGFHDTFNTVNVLAQTAVGDFSIKWISANKVFAAEKDGKYYSNWSGADNSWNTSPDALGKVPEEGKIYVDVSNSDDIVSYRWTGTELVPINSSKIYTTIVQGAETAGKASNVFLAANGKYVNPFTDASNIWTTL